MIRINLSRLLSERHMTQADLAKITGIRPSTICDIYNSTCSFLKLQHIDLICKKLGCEVSEFIQLDT